MDAIEELRDTLRWLQTRPGGLPWASRQAHIEVHRLYEFAGHEVSGTMADDNALETYEIEQLNALDLRALRARQYPNGV